MTKTEIIIACLILGSPIIWFLGGALLKILWGFYPMVIGLGSAGWAVWTKGTDGALIAIVGVTAGILITWLWQRTRAYLYLDDKIEKIVFFGG